MTTTANEATALLPGEDGPLPMRWGGPAITDAEALGVARRIARTQIAQGRRLTGLSEPNELPPVDAPTIQSAHRLSPRLLMRVRAKAEMEDTTVSDVIRTALEAYASSAPGSRIVAIPPRLRPKEIVIDHLAEDEDED